MSMLEEKKKTRNVSVPARCTFARPVSTFDFKGVQFLTPFSCGSLFWLGGLHFVLPPLGFGLLVFVWYCCPRTFLYSCDLGNLVRCFSDFVRFTSFQDRASELYRPHSKVRTVKARIPEWPWGPELSQCGSAHA